jgi:hypothetical protein
MTDPAVATDFFETLDVQRDFAAKVAFGFVLGDLGPKGDDLLVGQVLDADVFADIGVFADLLGGRIADAENVGKTHDNAFF